MTDAFELTQARIKKDLDRVAAGDRRVAGAIHRYGYPAERRAGDPSFAHLLRILTGQQLSVKAAATIYGRLEQSLGAPPCPRALLASPDAELRAIGLSRQKMAYARGLAEAVCAGHLEPMQLVTMSDAEVIDTLTALNGFGRWSGEMFLMFALGRCDVWPVDDLGIRAGLQILLRLEERPGRQRAIELGDGWAPHRSAMALLLWHLHGKA
jgi:DNA-3-methyladenine glycosylase II